MIWRPGGYHVGLIVQIEDPENERIGACWFAGRLRQGDRLLVTAHSGDCFWDYRLLCSYGPDRVRLIETERISGYCLGKPHEKQPTTSEFHLLMAGEKTALTAQPWPEGVRVG